MAISTAHQKAARGAEQKRARNKPVRSSAKTRVKTAETLMASGELEQAAQAVNEAFSALDRAARKNVIHRNSAARRKSRLMAKLHKAKTTAISKPKKRTKKQA